MKVASSTSWKYKATVFYKLTWGSGLAQFLGLLSELFYTYKWGFPVTCTRVCIRLGAIGHAKDVYGSKEKPNAIRSRRLWELDAPLMKFPLTAQRLNFDQGKVKPQIGQGASERGKKGSKGVPGGCPPFTLLMRCGGEGRGRRGAVWVSPGELIPFPPLPSPRAPFGTDSPQQPGPKLAPNSPWKHSLGNIRAHDPGCTSRYAELAPRGRQGKTRDPHLAQKREQGRGKVKKCSPFPLFPCLLIKGNLDKGKFSSLPVHASPIVEHRETRIPALGLSGKLH